MRQIELVKIEFVSMKNHDALAVAEMEQKVQAMEGKMTGWTQVRRWTQVLRPRTHSIASPVLNHIYVPSLFSRSLTRR